MEKEVEIKLPKLGESIVNATIVQWFKKEGESVELDEPLLEVSTDKVNSEIPSPIAGTLKKIFADVDQELDVGAPLALIATLGEGEESAPQEMPPQTTEKQTTIPPLSENRFFSPVVLRLAQEKGLALEDLSKIPASGAGGRLTKKDLESYLETSPTEAAPISTTFEKVKMSGMRKAIADNMVRSFYNAPHATLISEVNLTEILAYLKKEKAAFLEKHGYKLTISSFIAKAIAHGAKLFPFINSSLEGDTIVLKPFVNLGLAVSVDQGLMVPVIKNCQTRTLTQIAKEISILSANTRDGKLAPDDVKEGTITLTNFGMSGTLIGIPIIRFPEVAIIGVGAINKKVLVKDDNTFFIGSTVHLSLTFDHRVIDGMYGCGFLNAVKTFLEQPVEQIMS